jgi:hypothetical protein
MHLSNKRYVASMKKGAPSVITVVTCQTTQWDVVVTISSHEGRSRNKTSRLQGAQRKYHKHIALRSKSTHKEICSKEKIKKTSNILIIIITYSILVYN